MDHQGILAGCVKGHQDDPDCSVGDCSADTVGFEGGLVAEDASSLILVYSKVALEDQGGRHPSC